MPPRTTTIEEFDDDTDLPLPSRALPNTGTRGALLEEITSDDEDDMRIPQHPTMPPIAPSLASTGKSVSTKAPPRIDKSEYKDWMALYPIYIDAKQPFKTGYRRIAREKSLWWPLSADMAQAAGFLGFQVVNEATSSHPRDWENPGRVRIKWKANGKQIKPQIKTKKELLETISALIQERHPELAPKDSRLQKKSETQPSDPNAPSSSKSPAPSKHKKRKIRPPKPPKPYPPLSKRLSPYSPALLSGVLIDAVKAGMDAMKQQQAEAQGAAAAAGVGKGKKKVIRVRG